MSDLSNTRNQLTAVERQITSLGARIRQEQAALDAALRQGKADAANTQQQLIAQLQQQRTQLQGTLKAGRQKLETIRQDTIAAAPAPNPLGALDSGVPIVLFPVRLETRFRTVGAGKELLIRVYPDDVHMDTHEPELTAEESSRGQRYWTQVWHSGTGTPESRESERLAWAQLADFSGPERAAWIARSLEPRNPGARPATKTDDAAAFPTAPDFPTPPERESSWTRRPYAAALPDRWIALGYTTAGRVLMAVGNAIPDKLTVGPSPDNDGPPQTGDALQLIDDEMRWLVDFDSAVQNGMALRVTLPAAAVNGLSRLIVVGVKGSMDPDESCAALTTLMEGHHYTRGMSFLMRGTPTNNTTTAGSGYGTADPGHERSFAAERQGPLFQPGSGTAGDVAARALGIDASVFMNSWNAGDADDAPARNLNTALWPTTWGYYLTNRLPGLVSDAGIAAFRSHAIAYVRGGGPLPSLRLRHQPYGLLPVTALDLWQPVDAGDIGGRALTVMRSLQEAFSRAARQLPKMGATADPDQDLLSVLRMSPVSTRYATRSMAGPWHMDNFYTFIGTPLNAAWWAAQAAAASVNVVVPGMPANTPQATALFSPMLQEVAKPLVSAGATQDYLTALASADLTTLRNNTILPAGQRPLLYDLAQHSLLLAYAGAAYRMQLRAGLITAAQRVEPELVDIDTSTETLTIWRQFERKIANVTGAQTLREFLNDPAHESNPDASELAEIRQSLRLLGSVPSAKLEMLEREALDTASHRFDAWVTSLATRRLDTVRKRRPTGAFVGGYGWVEDLAPSGSTRSDGYIQTPSMAQANTAAILASGYMAHRGQAGGNPFAIDLSSPRVKLAYRLIEGVRTGQPIGALLGYQLERELHDQNLSPFVAKFRALAPLASSPTAAEVSEAVAANNVVHGIRILDLWKNKDPKFQALRTLANLADFQKIDIVFAKMADQLDALGDVILADNMHQVAEGNFDRAAMTLSAVIAGQTIPEPDVLRTPRTGTAHSHCVLTLLNPAQAPVPAWPVDGMQARAAAEPALNAWAARMLGDPAKIRCRVTYSAGVNPLRVVKLSELKISPLDAIYSTSASGSTCTSEFEQRLTYLLLRTRPADVPADATVALDYSRDPQATPDIVSFDEFLAMTAALRALLAKARPLTASDLALPDRNVPPSIDAAELSARANAAVTALKNANSRLKAALAAAGTPLEPVRTALVRLVYLGLSNGVPVSAVDGGPNDARLVSQGRSAFADITDRVKKLDDMAAAFSPANAKPEALLDFETRRLRAIFGPDFPVLPRFTLPQADEAVVAFGNSDALQRNRRIEAPSWFARAARVREGLGRLADVLRLTEVLGRGIPAWTVGQMPFVPGESWVALPLTSGTIPGGRLSLVAYGPLPAALNQPLAGMVFDEWTEVIPNRSETTGLAFHYDRPNARPPQSILLAVAPDLSQPWNLLTLEQILRETLELSKCRLVDQDAMIELDHYLPAICLPINAAGETIAVDVRAS